MQKWEYLLLAVSVHAWQKPAPVIAMIDTSGQVLEQTFSAFHAHINELGEQGWELTHVEEHCWIFKRLKQASLSSASSH